MKKNADLQKFREMSSADLKKKVNELGEELLRLRFKHGSGQLDQHAQLQSVRRNIARANTVLGAKVAEEAAQQTGV